MMTFTLIFQTSNLCMPTVKLPHIMCRADMDAAMKPPGLLQGKCIFKKLPNGNLNKTKVVRVPLRYPVVQGKSSARQTTMFECNRGKPVSTALSAKPTNLAQWIATSCRPISVVEDDGLELVLQAATGDQS